MSYPPVGASASPGLHPASARRRRTRCGPAESTAQTHTFCDSHNNTIVRLRADLTSTTTKTHICVPPRPTSPSRVSRLSSTPSPKTISFQQLRKQRAARSPLAPRGGNQGAAGETQDVLRPLSPPTIIHTRAFTRPAVMQ